MKFTYVIAKISQNHSTCVFVFVINLSTLSCKWRSSIVMFYKNFFSTEANKLKISNVIQWITLLHCTRNVWSFPGGIYSTWFMIEPSPGSLSLSFVVLALLGVHFQQWLYSLLLFFFLTLWSSLPTTVIT